MNNRLMVLVFKFLIIIGLQILVLNNIAFSGIINPYLYAYLILILPIDLNQNVVLFIGFLLGFVVDVFSQTMGMHIMATTAMAFSRPYILKYMAPRDGYEASQSVSLHSFGWLWMATFSGILILIHHLFLFSIEHFRMSGVLFTVGKALVSGFFTVILIFITELLFNKLPKRGGAS